MVKTIGDEPVARAEAVPIRSFRNLVREVAHLSYFNKDHLLFFRGQDRDFQNKAGSSTIYPSIYRGERVPRDQLGLAFDVLRTSSARLCRLFESEGVLGYRDLRRRKYVQWSILQHYEVCATPLLDLTHSLLVACSFAFLSGASEPLVLVFGLPFLTNRISINSEHDLVNVRLLSICPPEALRPYFQEGYLAGTDGVLAEFDSKTELDFANRLVAKFRLVSGRGSFWGDGVRSYSRSVLYPKRDKVEKLCNAIKTESVVSASHRFIGQFLHDWTELEGRVIHLARSKVSDQKIHSMRKAVDFLMDSGILPAELAEALHEVRRVRNDVVHTPAKVPNRSVARASTRIRGLLMDLASLPQAT